MIAGLVMLAAFSAVPAFGNTITVTDTSDSSPNSLRAAIAAAAPGDTINFSLAHPATITLSSTLTISNDLTISGPGAGNLAISGNNSVQVFFIDGAITVTISEVTIENGSSYDGGGIRVHNYYGSGGPAGCCGMVTVTNSILSGNSSTNTGGGISNFGGTLTVTNSTLSGNSSEQGGGIYNGVGTVTVIDSTFSDNSTPNTGGGINSYLGTVTVTNSTLSGNSAGYGGGIGNTYSTVTVTNSTLSGNSASGHGGDFFNSSGTVTVKNSIVANSPSGGNCFNYNAFVSQGHNLSDDGSCTTYFTQTGDLNYTPAGLDPKGLQNNGGPTQTIALLATSPAVDAIPVSPTNYCTDTNGNPVTTDQRGVTRPQGPACDIGAFELRPGQASALTSNFNGTPIGGRDIVWFNSVLKVQGLGASPVNVYLTNATIQFVAGGTPYNLSVPNATITFSPTATSATTTYDAGSNTWLTTVPSSGLAGNTFLDALAFLVPGGGLPGGIKVTWQGSFASDTPGITVDWKWAAAVYTSFGIDYNADGVKPVDDNKASVYKNSDHAGTPENFKGSVIGGATGGGGSNFTGGYSGTQTIQF